ncbi:MAG: preprotein translocase subunit TatB [Rhodobiaceae bacterium]|nr:MAG: preprotein translocase subunit TatB [Rhodobiaceae bacterium]
MSDVHEVLLDVTGLTCPLPVLRAQKLLRESVPGAVIKVLATDPVAAIDFPHFCQESGHELLETGEHPHPDGRTGSALFFRIKCIAS